MVPYGTIILAKWHKKRSFFILKSQKNPQLLGSVNLIWKIFNAKPAKSFLYVCQLNYSEIIRNRPRLSQQKRLKRLISAFQVLLEQDCSSFISLYFLDYVWTFCGKHCNIQYGRHCLIICLHMPLLKNTPKTACFLRYGMACSDKSMFSVEGAELFKC